LLKYQSPLGGGVELIVAMLFALLFLPRSRFFYYMNVTGMQYFITLQLRLTMADPRPFHIDESIEPWMCYANYGNPGDHAMAGVTAAIVIFLDIFHGTPIQYSYQNPIFYSWKEYFAGLFFAFYWMIIMPYTRYVGGIQSID
jgi:hypothetical protein